MTTGQMFHCKDPERFRKIAEALILTYCGKPAPAVHVVDLQLELIKAYEMGANDYAWWKQGGSCP